MSTDQELIDILQQLEPQDIVDLRWFCEHDYPLGRWMPPVCFDLGLVVADVQQGKNAATPLAHEVLDFHHKLRIIRWRLESSP